MEQSDVGKINPLCSSLAMKLPLLRILSFLLSFGVFEVSLCMPFLIPNGFGTNEWFRELVFVSSPFVAMSQATLLAMWGGLGAPAMHRRIFYAATCCVACLLIPVALRQQLPVNERAFVWNTAMTTAIAFIFCLVSFLIFSRLFRRRIVVVNEEGLASFATKSQFSLWFVSVVTLTVALFSLLVNVYHPNNIKDETAPASALGLLVFGLVAGVICSAQGLAFTWILLRPNPFQPRTISWLAVTAPVFVCSYVAIWFAFEGWSSSTRHTNLFFMLFSAIVVLLGSTFVSLGIMRNLDFRLVRNDQLNEVVKNPLARPTAVAEWPSD